MGKLVTQPTSTGAELIDLFIKVVTQGFNIILIKAISVV